MKNPKNLAKSYNEEGFLIIDDLFSKQEVEAMSAAVHLFEDLKDQPNIIKETNGEIRSVFAPHLHSEVFNEVYRQEKIISLLEEINQEKLYLYQYKLNNKKAFIGEAWEWHQDFPYWNIDDGVPKSDMFSVMILLQDTTYYQGPLVVIPKSHKIGIVDFEPKPHLINVNKENKKLSLASSLSADLKYTIKRTLIHDLIEENGIKEFNGKAGSVMIFHPNLFHASGTNFSPYDRNTAIITYNSINNTPPHVEKINRRPNYVCNRDFSPIEAIGKSTKA